MTAFWLLAPVMVAAALGILFVRKAVHAALLLAVVMISLAVLYLPLEAPFLFAVQIIVYTGAILMLFLFVMMLVGVDASDSLVETLKGQRILAAGTGLVFGALVVIGVGQVGLGAAVGLEAANEGGNIEALANIMFGRYVVSFEITAALLITAALGAMVLAHRERLEPRKTQPLQAEERMQAWRETGAHLGPLPPPGVFARHNAVDTAALLPDGSAAESSVSRVLAARGSVRTAPEYADDVESMQQALGQDAGVDSETSTGGTDTGSAGATTEGGSATVRHDPDDPSGTASGPAAGQTTDAPGPGTDAPSEAPGAPDDRDRRDDGEEPR